MQFTVVSILLKAMMGETKSETKTNASSDLSLSVLKGREGGGDLTGA